MSHRQKISGLARYVANLHLRGGKPDIFILSTARSGSTWLMEAIAADRTVRPCNEPLNIRKPEVVRRLGIDDWNMLGAQESLPTIERYFRALLHGGIGYSFKTPRPFEKSYHPITNRVVMKILFGCEDRIAWLKETFNAKVVCLIRHPIPVSISREEIPRLPSLLASDYVRSMPAPCREAAERVYREGNSIELAQLDWCLQNRPLLDSLDSIDLFVTYEQLVLQPDKVAERLAGALDLSDARSVKSSLGELSGSVSKSSEASLQLLLQRQADAYALIAKWRKSITSTDEQSLMRVVSDLGIDIYRAGSLLPDKRFWLGDEYPQSSVDLFPTTALVR